MGSDCNQRKRHYDITMSRRTRRPSQVQDALQNSTIDSPGDDTPAIDVVKKGDENSPSRIGEAEEKDGKKSLKQLIKGRSSLGQHFNEEQKQQLQIVKVQHQGDDQRVKLKRLVSRYVKVLSHLIKVKHDLPPKGESRKKPLLQLKI